MEKTTDLNGLNLFKPALKKSHENMKDPFWEKFYKKAFPNLVAIHDFEEDGWWQRAGIDRIIVMPNSSVIKIDEKVRYNVEYTDIFLENYSNKEKKIPGWMNKQLDMDYLAYVIWKTKKGYLLPYRDLTRAWEINKHSWKKEYSTTYADKVGMHGKYQSSGITVPIDVVVEAIKKTYII